MQKIYKVYICSIKVIGMPFVVETKEQADDWVKKDPELNYYTEAKFYSIPKLSLSEQISLLYKD